MGAIGEGIGYNFFYSYFIFFMINIAGVNPAVAGTVSLIAVFWDAVTDPIIGSMSTGAATKGGAEHRLSNTALYSSESPWRLCSSISTCLPVQR